MVWFLLYYPDFCAPKKNVDFMDDRGQEVQIRLEQQPIVHPTCGLSKRVTASHTNRSAYEALQSQI